MRGLSSNVFNSPDGGGSSAHNDLSEHAANSGNLEHARRELAAENVIEFALVVTDFVDGYHAGTIRSISDPDVRAYNALVYAAYYLRENKSRMEEFSQRGYLGPTSLEAAAEFLKAGVTLARERRLISSEQAEHILAMEKEGRHGLDTAIFHATGLTSNIKLARERLRNALEEGLISAAEAVRIASIPDSNERARVALRETWRQTSESWQISNTREPIHPYDAMSDDRVHQDAPAYSDPGLRRVFRLARTSTVLQHRADAPETAAANYLKSAIFLAEKIGFLSPADAMELRAMHAEEACYELLGRLAKEKSWSATSKPR